MLESTVGDCAKELRLEQEVAETSGVNADVTALRTGVTSDGQIALLLFSIGGGAIGSSCGCGLGGLRLLVGVVDEILLGSHVG